MISAQTSETVLTVAVFEILFFYPVLLLLSFYLQYSEVSFDVPGSDLWNLFIYLLFWYMCMHNVCSGEHAMANAQRSEGDFVESVLSVSL